MFRVTCGRSLFRRRFGLQTLWQLFPSSQPMMPMVERVKNWPTKTYVLCGLSWDASKDFGGTGNHIPSVISSHVAGLQANSDSYSSYSVCFCASNLRLGFEDYSDRSHAVCSKLCNVWQLLEEPPVITTAANLEKLKLGGKARMATFCSIFV